MNLPSIKRHSWLGTLCSPSPRPSPQGRGRIAGCRSQRPERPDLSNHGVRDSLSPGERAGARGNQASVHSVRPICVVSGAHGVEEFQGGLSLPGTSPQPMITLEGQAPFLRTPFFFSAAFSFSLFASRCESSATTAITPPINPRSPRLKINPLILCLRPKPKALSAD